MEKIFSLLIPKFDYAMCVIDEIKDLDFLTIDELKGIPWTHEDKIKRRHEELLEQVLKSMVFLKDDRGERSQKGLGRE